MHARAQCHDEARYEAHLTNQTTTQVDSHRSSIFNYLLFLRITPLLPNWFINLASPVLGIPYKPFALATLLGIMPLTILTVRAGLTLQELEGSPITLETILVLFGLGFVSLIPTLKPVQQRLSSLLGGTKSEIVTGKKAT
jgi:uncharacterized membrane protein YdjX (TVP38/TMEM64 family)